MSKRRGYVHFFEETPKTKTKVWTVMSAIDSPKGDGGAELGEVRWWSHWRKYAFFPNPNTLFEQLCLREIANFCETQTKQHRAVLTPQKEKERE